MLQQEQKKQQQQEEEERTSTGFRNPQLARRSDKGERNAKRNRIELLLQLPLPLLRPLALLGLPPC